MSTIATLHKKRGVVPVSITKLSNKLTDTDELADWDEALRHAQRLSTRLNTLDGDFKTHHFDVAAIDEKDNEAHAAEQAVIDKHEKEVDALTVWLELYWQYSLPQATIETPTYQKDAGQHNGGH